MLDVNLLDALYPEGGISIICNGQVLLEPGQWDLPDRLFLLFAAALVQVKQEGKAGFMFPDSPVDVILRLKKGGFLLLRIGNRATVVLVEEFAVALFDAAILFFENFLRLNPRYNGDYESDLALIREQQRLYGSFRIS
ncbi:MAG: hypothetical protein LUE98_11230 [Tannerellaceae bacterium]|nr:hypothetical protein [Tannerellaceae bacterium]